MYNGMAAGEFFVFFTAAPVHLFEKMGKDESIGKDISGVAHGGSRKQASRKKEV